MFTYPLADHIITRGFAYLSSIYVGGQHAAIDFIRRTGNTCASPIRVIADGTVVGVGWDFYSGFFVAVDHADGWRSFYRHLYGQSPVVIGQRVSQGQIIGNVGNTGYSLGAHLHFDLWNRNKMDATAFWKNGWWAHDPELYLGKEDAMTSEDERKIKEMITAALRVWMGPRDNRVADIDIKLAKHTRNTAVHSGGGTYTDARAVKAVKDALPD